jgi:hypothetical protein
MSIVSLPLVPVVVIAASLTNASSLDPNDSDHFGLSTLALGDVNGDGVPDQAIGSPSQYAWMFCGATGRPIWRVDALEGGGRFAKELRAAGDVDGDRVTDVLVSVPATFGASWQCAVRVLSGSTGRTIGEVGPFTKAKWGPQFDGVGDVDGDGASDFVVDNVLYSGRALAPLRVLAGPASSVEARVSLSAVGDLDGDGVSDVAFASAELADGWLSFASTRTGECIGVVNGWKWGAPGLSWRDGHSTFSVSPKGDAYFGEWVAPAGDVDCDGTPDMLVGSGVSRSFPGRAWVVSGRGATPICAFELGEESREAAGFVGDTNGDGYVDVAADASGVFYRRVEVRLGPVGSSRWTSVDIPVDDDGYGLFVVQRITSAGDVDRDGGDDYLISVVCTNDPGPPGCVILISGKTGNEIRRYDTLTALAQWEKR